MDWQSMVNALRKEGLSQADIARVIGVTQPTVSDISRGEHGGRIAFHIGAKLVELWRERCAGGDPSAAPPSIPEPAKDAA